MKKEIQIHMENLWFYYHGRVILENIHAEMKKKLYHNKARLFKNGRKYDPYPDPRRRGKTNQPCGF